MTPKWRPEMSWTPPGVASGPRRDEPAVPEDLWDHPGSFFGRPWGVQGPSGGAFWTLPGAFWVSIRLSSLLLSSLPVASSKKVNKFVFFFLFVSLPKCSIICVFSSGSALGRSLFRTRLVSSVRPKIHPKWYQHWSEKWVRAVPKISQVKPARSGGPLRPFGLAVWSVWVAQGACFQNPTGFGVPKS